MVCAFTSDCVSLYGETTHAAGFDGEFSHFPGQGISVCTDATNPNPRVCGFDLQSVFCLHRPPNQVIALDLNYYQWGNQTCPHTNCPDACRDLTDLYHTWSPSKGHFKGQLRAEMLFRAEIVEEDLLQLIDWFDCLVQPAPFHTSSACHSSVLVF